MQLGVDEQHVCVNTTITNHACSSYITPRCGMFCFLVKFLLLLCSGDGGTIAAIVVSILLLVAGVVIVVLIILVIYTRRKKRIRRYSFNHSFRSTETDRSRIYINVTAATGPQVQLLLCITAGQNLNFASFVLAAL